MSDREIESVAVESKPGVQRVQVNVVLSTDAWQEIARRFPGGDLACRAVNEVLRDHLGELTDA